MDNILKIKNPTIENPKYGCPKCGETEWAINVTIPGMECSYCQKCYAEWLEENIPRVRRIK